MRRQDRLTQYIKDKFKARQRQAHGIGYRGRPPVRPAPPRQPPRPAPQRPRTGRYKNRDSVTVEFETGYRLVTTKDVLTKSKTPRLRDPLAKTVFGVGRIGVGPHKAHTKGADTKAFSIWRAMLRRCYYAPEDRAWRDAKVCELWHDFQNFAEWFEQNYPRDGRRYQLDKDIKLPGNKTYSPQYCQFVTQQQNLEARRRGRFSPRGV